MAKNVVVIGTQWGDEGKGKVVDWLTDHADGVGKAFGRARPATGFTLYLLELARLAPAGPVPGCIRAPRVSDAALEAAMARLRRAGEVVIQDLPGHENESDEGRCERELVKQKGKWQVRKI